MTFFGGTPNDDTVDGEEGADVLLGAGGDDLLGGREGGDLIAGDEGDDTLYGGDNDDLVSGGADNDDVYGEDGGDQLNGGAGDDIVSGGAGPDFVAGGTGNDILYGMAQFGFDLAVDTLSYWDATGSVTVDLRIGSAQNTGGGGTDYFTGFENLSGSDYDDTLKGTDGANGIYGGDSGKDRLYGYGGNDTVTGAGELNGGDGDDRLVAMVYEQVGNVLCGGAGNDTLEGAGYSNFAAFFDATAGVLLDLRITGPQDTGSAGVDTLTNINHILGSAYADVFRDRGDVNVVFTGDGDDIFYSQGSDDTVDGETIRGGAGIDTLAFNDLNLALQPVWAYGVNLQSGVVSPKGGPFTGIVNVLEFERYIGTNVNDKLDGGFAAETFIGLDGNDSMLGLGGADTLVGGAGDDFLQGADGADTADYSAVGVGVVLDLRLTSAQADGLGGMDRLFTIENLEGTVFADTLTGNTEINRLVGNAGNDSMSGLGANDLLNGGNGADSLTGDAGNDQLLGGAKDDVLKGGGDNDTLIGGDGADRLTGGAGIDIFRFDSIKEIAKGELITDLANFDVIDLSRIDANENVGGDQAFVLVASFSSQAGEARLRFVPEAGETRLLLDVTGDGQADGTLILAGDHRAYNAFVL